jgi:hypothetical protein
MSLCPVLEGKGMVMMEWPRATLARILAAGLGAAAFLAPTAAAPATPATTTEATQAAALAPNIPAPGTYAGRGFDACTAPSQSLMTTWLSASPYRAVGIYTSGINRFCAQPNLTSSWVSTQQAAGWHLLPIHMGLQPYCTTSNKEFRFTAANAVSSGRAAADEAVAAARALGLAAETAIFLDVEAYSTTDPACRAAVLNYQSAWTTRLHDLGFLSGFYSSLGSGVADQVTAYPSPSWVRPDYLWFARYDGVATVSNPAIPESYWPHRRIKQYQSPAQTGGPETWGGMSLSVDRNQLDVTPVQRTPFGDFNRNGWPDLLARQTSTGHLFLYPGNGGRFGPAVRIGTGWNGMNAITRLGDFDRDGREDILARESATGALWLYRGTGSGFSERVRIGNAWNGMREITPIGDLDRDGYSDLLAVQMSTGCLYYYRGQGSSLVTGVRIGCSWNTMSELMGAGDFNRDGRVDLVARTTATGELWLYPGTTGNLGTRFKVGSGWGGMRDLTGIGDFDRDGFTDLIAVNTTTGDLFRYPGRGTSFGSGLKIGVGWSEMQPLL